jgi:hypothetical protein
VNSRRVSDRILDFRVRSDQFGSAKQTSVSMSATLVCSHF